MRRRKSPTEKAQLSGYVEAWKRDRVKQLGHGAITEIMSEVVDQIVEHDLPLYVDPDEVDIDIDVTIDYPDHSEHDL